MATKAEGKNEYIILNIGSGVQVGSSLAFLGVAETLDEAMKLIHDMGTAHPGKIVIAKKEKVILRTPMIELTESDEALIEKSKP